MNLVVQFLAIGFAGSLGAMLRYVIAAISGRFFGTAFPVGTFLINVTGSAFLGWFLTVTRDRLTVTDTLRLAVAVGFVGAYTTFSTFAYESNALLENGSWIKALANLFGSLLFGLIAVRVGIWMGSP